MKVIFNVLVLLCIGCVAGGCGGSRFTPQQRKEMETKILDADKEVVMQATISVLQDSGYMITHTDATTGLIRAESGGKTGFWGVTKSAAVTATMEQWGEGKSKARITFVEGQKSQMAMWGGGVQTVEDSKVISTPELMQKVYADIEKEIFIRKNLNR